MEILILLNSGALALSLLKTFKYKKAVKMIGSAVPFEPGCKGISKVTIILESESPIKRDGKSFIVIKIGGSLLQAPLIPSQQHLKYFVPIIHKLNKDTYGQSGIEEKSKPFTVIAHSDGCKLLPEKQYIVSVQPNQIELFVDVKRKYKKANAISIVCAVSLIAAVCTRAFRN